MIAGVFIAYFIWGIRRRLLRKSGIPATAQVEGLEKRPIRWNPGTFGWELGLTVQIPGREPYFITYRTFLDRFGLQNAQRSGLMAYQPGETIAVRVDPKNPNRIAIDDNRASTLWALEPVRAPLYPRSGPGSFDTAVADQMQMMNRMRQMPGDRAEPIRPAADLLATGQRVSGVLKSFADTGTTPRRMGLTPGRPDLIDAPHYNLVIELHFPNLAPMEARTFQPVPPAQVPNLVIGLQLPCAVDPANPQLCVVDWDAIAG
jgi:hypothetical protein